MDNNYQEIIDHAIEEQELYQDFSTTRKHFRVPMGFFSFTVCTLFLTLNYFSKDDPNYFWVGILAIGAGLGCFHYYKVQQEGLKFELIETSLSREKLLLVLKEIATEMKWLHRHQEENLIIGYSDNGIFSSSTEQITIVLDGQNVLINSIADPSGYEGGAISKKRNKANLIALREGLLKAEKGSSVDKQI